MNCSQQFLGYNVNLTLYRISSPAKEILQNGKKFIRIIAENKIGKKLKQIVVWSSFS